MKVIIEQKDFKNEFSYYEDVLGGKDKKIIGVKFWYQGEEVDIEEIEIVIDEEPEVEKKEPHDMDGII